MSEPVGASLEGAEEIEGAEGALEIEVPRASVGESTSDTPF